MSVKATIIIPFGKTIADVKQLLIDNGYGVPSIEMNLFTNVDTFKNLKSPNFSSSLGTCIHGKPKGIVCASCQIEADLKPIDSHDDLTRKFMKRKYNL